MNIHSLDTNPIRENKASIGWTEAPCPQAQSRQPQRGFVAENKVRTSFMGLENVLRADSSRLRFSFPSKTP